MKIMNNHIKIKEVKLIQHFKNDNFYYTYFKKKCFYVTILVKNVLLFKVAKIKRIKKWQEKHHYQKSETLV